MPPQPFRLGMGVDICPMKSVDGFSGKAMPKEKPVLASRKRWKFMPVSGSAKAVVCWSAACSELARRSSGKRLEVFLLALDRFEGARRACDVRFEVRAVEGE